MALLKYLVFALSATICALSLPSSNVTGELLTTLPKRSGTPSSAGAAGGGFYYSWWTDNQGDATYTNGPGNDTFTIRWSGNGNIVAGKG